MTTTPEDDRRVVGVVEKNRREEVRITLTRFEGHDLVDLRIFTDVDGERGRKPTKKGVALKTEKLPALIEVLQTAQRAVLGKTDG